jgi:L-alanine-DL-glutamate epimerase-like enolase superfamily enzyme
MRPSPTIDSVTARPFTLATSSPEADGTLCWDSTTMVVVNVQAGMLGGLGYTYADASAADLINRVLAPRLKGLDATAIPRAVVVMAAALRNIGLPGIGACALSAVDVALWDLKARWLELPLTDLLGQAQESVMLYGSGGFTSYDLPQLTGQLGSWAKAGFSAVKMKVGTHPDQDLARVAAVRQAIGAEVALFVDANGAYDRAQALGMAHGFAEHGVTWFEEPVSSDDLEGLRFLRDRAPPGMAIAAGEYGWDLYRLRLLLAAGAVDVLQADASRCGGISGFLRAAALCAAHGVPLSAHTAPALHLAVCCACPELRHLEYFHDHARFEEMMFDGVAQPRQGRLAPDRAHTGLGLSLKPEARRHAA